MKQLLCLLAVVAAAALGPEPSTAPPAEYSGITLEDVTALVKAMEQDTLDMGLELGSQAAFASIVDGKLQNVKEFMVPEIELQNAQQVSLSEQYNAQVKELQHKLDAVKAEVAELDASYDEEEMDLNRMNEFLDQLEDQNDEQDDDLMSLSYTLSRSKDDFLDKVQMLVSNFTDDADKLTPHLMDIADFISNKQCLFGVFAMKEGANPVAFQTPLPYTPSVTLSLSGFNAHVDVYSYDSYGYDILALSKNVVNATVDGFDVMIDDMTDGQISLKGVYCSWMACTGLDSKFYEE